MVKLSFREVMAIIKENETWSNGQYDIYLQDDIIKITSKSSREEICFSTYYISDKKVWELISTRVRFGEAWSAHERGRVVKSLVSEYCYDTHNNNDDLRTITKKEIRGWWIIV